MREEGLMADLVVPETKKLLRKDLATVSSCGHLGRFFERSVCEKLNYVLDKG
jgi:hypothetical protein